MKVQKWILYLQSLREEGIEVTQISVEWLLEFLRECPENMAIKGIPLHPYGSPSGRVRFYIGPLEPHQGGE